VAPGDEDLLQPVREVKQASARTSEIADFFMMSSIVTGSAEPNAKRVFPREPLCPLWFKVFA
jgi:hypothetical protein